jgi:hypothetical protein
MGSNLGLSGQGVYGDQGEASVNLNEFQQLLDRLEGSKKRQVRQKSVEDRRGTFAQGLASMMSNF